ncbi:uncharacterized protein [Typha latifolia]|uniref:uncharacterized protein n=1 Tax=Typha latifolia TaxID=4733 RepID=UPI003C2B0B34
MVQRKASNKPFKPDSPQDKSSKGGADTKKKVKHLSSIKTMDMESGCDHLNHQASSSSKRKKTKKLFASKKLDGLPNYMKPTNSSVARKEQLQVTHHSPAATCRNRSPRNLNNLTCSTTNPARIIKRKPSLKPIRPSKLHVNRATCSSTIKDSKFPKFLDLNPGATEAEGTSVFKVCPYKYCSLNGHWHEPLPPLKCFLRSRRNLMKTQQSMKLKGFSPFRKKGLRTGQKDIDTGQGSVSRTHSGLKITPLIEEVVNDFFIEIYANPKDGKTEEEDVKSAVNEITEAISDISLEDDGDSHNDISIAEMDSMMKSLECVSCDQQYVAEDISLKLQTEDDEEQHLECCRLEESGKTCHMGLVEDLNPYPGNDTDSFDCTVDELGPTPGYPPENDDPNDLLSFELYFALDTYETAECDEEISCDILGNQVDELSQGKDPNYSSTIEGSIADAIYEEILEEDEESEIRDSFPEQDVCAIVISEDEANDSSENDITNEEDSYEGEDTKTSSLIGQLSITSQGFDTISKSPVEGDAMQEEVEITINKEEVTIKEPRIQPESENFSFCNQSNTGEQDEASEEHECTGTHDTFNVQDEDASEIDEICIAFSAMSLKEDKSSDVLTVNNLQKRRFDITRRRTNEEPEEMKDFNPRGPRFLPVEPDPEAERIDLRHQMMDDRKNAEEWMLDYALQKAVTKLAPARKRKVALMVEAFETVLPLPMYQEPMQHVTTSFTQVRPIQACS